MVKYKFRQPGTELLGTLRETAPTGTIFLKWDGIIYLLGLWVWLPNVQVTTTDYIFMQKWNYCQTSTS